MAGDETADAGWADDASAMSFEEALKELESVVSRLEAGDVPLEESIALYERGARLKAHCEARLAQAQARIEQITQAENGAPAGTQAFEAG
ncbi:MAG: exodeoxyribonuclease VII small subunit [Pararhodobacter sp.]